MKTYFYTVAIGEKFEKMADLLVRSAEKVGMEIDIYSPDFDPEDQIRASRMGKIDGFRNMPSGYDRACFIDADCLILKNFTDISIDGAMIEDWKHKCRKYYPRGVEESVANETLKALNCVLDDMGMTEMRMDEVGERYAKDNDMEYFGGYEWNGGVISGTKSFLTDLMDEWERWHGIIDDLNDGVFIRDQISFKYAYYNIGWKKWGYRTIPREFNWHTKRWDINRDVYILHEAGYVRKHKNCWKELIDELFGNEIVKVQFCCGKNRKNKVFSDWKNYDKEMDIREPLPIEDNTVDFIYCEHGLEHIPFDSVVPFLDECYRILRKGGVVRLAVPCVEILKDRYDKEYEKLRNEDQRWLRKMGWKRIDKEKSIYQLMFGFKHKSFFTITMLVELLSLCGFEPQEEEINSSNYPDLAGIDGTGRGKNFHKFFCQTGIVEGKK